MGRLAIVLDTAPLVASADRRDRAAGLARQLISRGAGDMIVPDPVLAEAEWLIRSRISPASARSLLESVRVGDLKRVPLDGSLYDRAVEYDRTYKDLNLGLVDASVMALAEQTRGLVLTFDFRDFRATRPLRGGWWRLAIDEETYRRFVPT
ncbi:MAG: type II toxin-antitoxin system VapC family toxin [Actinomycetota bacterium]